MRFAGPLGRLPAGAPTLAALIEHREESFDDGFANFGGTLVGYFPSLGQSVDSAYLEFTVPIVSPQNDAWAVRDLQLQIAGRYDDYTVDGATGFVVVGSAEPIARVKNQRSSVNPTLGLKYQPVQDVILRASYGTGFLPPSVLQVVPNPLPSNSSGGIDPRRGNSPTDVIKRSAARTPICCQKSPRAGPPGSS